MKRWLGLALSLTCAGCMTAAAIVQSPELASLNPEPPRYFEASLDLLLEEKPYHVDYSWACEHRKVFTASVMQWVLKWRSEFKIVARSFADGTTVYFWQPIAYCLSDTARFVPKIVVSRNESRPATITLYDSRYDQGTRTAVNKVVANGAIRRINAPSGIGKMTERDEALAASLSADIGNYVTRRLYIVPESVWKQSQTLNRMLPEIHEVTSAKNHNPKGNGYFAPIGGVPSGAFAGEQVRQFNPRLRGDQLVLGSEVRKDPERLFRLEESQRSDGPVQLCYQEGCIKLEGAINEVYYPSTRELIYVTQFSLKTAFSP